MKIIDAHLHLWNTATLNYQWLQEVPAINKTFLIEDYHAATSGYDIDKMVFVQCECLPGETLHEVQFVNEQRSIDNRISGMVAYAPLERGIAAEPVLEHLLADPLVRSVRRMTGDDPELCLQAGFLTSMKWLAKHEVPFDVTIKPYQVKQALQLIELCPENIFILDHLGKPDIANNGLDQFKKDIKRFAAFPNCIAKVSGLVTEANWNNWTQKDIQPYIEVAIEQFGFERLMFGSDWPVVTLAGSFKKWVDVALEITKNCTSQELDQLFYQTAKKAYRI